MKVRFDGLRKITRLHGVFRAPGEDAEMRQADAEDAIRRGLARPLRDTAVSGPTATTAIRQHEALRKASRVGQAKKAEGGGPNAEGPPLFVVTPTKGGRAEDLDRTLASLCFEAPPGVAICVVLDGPNDHGTTERVVKWWEERLRGSRNTPNVQLRVSRHSARHGVNRSRMKAIQEAPANAVIVEVDDHDVPEPGALNKVREVFLNKSIRALYADYYIADARDRLVRRKRLESYWDGLFLKVCPSNGLRAYRKSLYVAVGGYREHEYPAGDYFLWLRFAAYLEDVPKAFAFVPEPLSRFKMCSDSISVTHAKEQAMMQDRAVLAAMTGTILPGQRVPTEETAGLPDYRHVTETGRGSWRPYRDTAIVVPCFKSANYVPGLLASMGEEQEAVILVSDGDGEYELGETAQIVLSENTGFAHACNVGARRTRSKYICFLNADVEVKPGWLDAMIEEMESSAAADIAIVGNRQLDGQGRIHSCGSEFSWKTRNFDHVCRDEWPAGQPEWHTARDLDMITASCWLIRRDVFEAMGGFDERFRRGYWEDTDLCMKIRRAGYRIRFTPRSQITHFQGRSGGSVHRYHRQNAQLCRSRWVDTGLVDKFAKRRGRRPHGGQIVACYIVLNEEEFIQASLESIYDFADRIIIVEGGNDYAVAAGLCGPDKCSTDATVEQIRAFPDPEEKIELLQGEWTDKVEQRNAYARLLRPGDWMLLMDGDEVFFDRGIWRLSALMHEREVIQPRFYLFWNDFMTVGTGVWDAYPQVKVVKWREGYHYRDHNCPCDGDGGLIVRGNPQAGCVI